MPKPRYNNNRGPGVGQSVRFLMDGQQGRHGQGSSGSGDYRGDRRGGGGKKGFSYI